MGSAKIPRVSVSVFIPHELMNAGRELWCFSSFLPPPPWISNIRKCFSVRNWALNCRFPILKKINFRNLVSARITVPVS